jgi:hypothetical protein
LIAHDYAQIDGKLAQLGSRPIDFDREKTCGHIF